MILKVGLILIIRTAGCLCQSRDSNLFFGFAFFALAFFFLAVGDNVGKSFVVKVALGVNWSCGHHRVELFFCKSVGLGGKDIAEVVFWDGSSSFWVKKFKSREDNVFRVSSMKFISQHVQENGEINSRRRFCNHSIKFGRLNGHDTKGGVGGLQVVLVDETVTVGVNHAECFLEFLNLRLLKRGENIGGILCLLLSLSLCHFDLLY